MSSTLDGGRATVHDVARVAGVSIKTVSRVANGSQLVGDATRQQVLTAIQALGYVQNVAARSLRTGSSDTIGIVVDALDDPYFATLVSVVEDRALAGGLNVVVGATGGDTDRERAQVLRLARQNVRGLLLAPVGRRHDYLAATDVRMPIVLIDRRWELPGYDSVRVQDRAGARLGVRHLLGSGHERIAFVGDDETLPTAADRRRGYVDALRGAGLTPTPALVRLGCGEPDSAAAVTTDLLALPEPPTAIFSSNPRATQGVVRALHRSARLDVALVSFGDFALADVLDPAITVIDQDPTAIAAAAAERILGRIAGDTADPADLMLPLELRPRGSGELPARPPHRRR